LKAEIDMNQSFLDHFSELRNRIIKSGLSIIFFSIVGYMLSDKIIELLILPTSNLNVSFQVLKITSIFLIKIGIAVVFGFFISIPIIIYQIFKFILPAIDNELTITKSIAFIVLYTFCILIGLLFGYFILIPTSITFFSSLSVDIPLVNVNYTLENYLIYLIWMLIISTIIFQLPFFIVILTKIGLIDIHLLKNYRRHVIVLFFIIAALFTPPDPISQIIVVIPLYLLFEFSIYMSRYIK
tara:strand:+ start:908 stop:1627 length:720 start_codon:yes stop_codon:yes gene_type:complete